MRIKIIFKIMFLFVLSGMLVLTFSSAHVLETSNNIGAVMHIDPDDDPIAQQESKFYFEFKDKDGQLDLSRCDCNAEIRNSSTQSLFKGPLIFSASSPDVLNLNYTFPSKDVYTIIINGTPKNGAKFSSFVFNYTVRVAKEGSSDSATKTNNILPLIIGMLVVIFIFVMLFFISYLLKKKKNEKK